MAKEYILKIENDLVVKKTEGEEITSSMSNESPSLNKSKEKLKDSVSKTIAVNMAKQAIQFVVTNYGDLTGDYVGQKNISAAIGMAGTVAMAYAGGPVGIAAAIASTAVQIGGFYLQRSIQDRNTAYLRARIGGSR